MSRERSELNDTGRATAQWQDGRRQKKCSAVCPSKARELLKCLKVFFEKEQTRFAASFRILRNVMYLTKIVELFTGISLFNLFFCFLSCFRVRIHLYNQSLTITQMVLFTVIDGAFYGNRWCFLR